MAFPEDPEDLEVGFAFGSSAAQDPTGLTYTPVTPDSALGSVTIQRGRVGDSGSTDPTEFEILLDDPDGDFSPRNVSGAHYGELRIGTPAQVRVDVGAGPVVRGRAAIPNWNPSWVGPDIEDRVRVQAFGTMSRLGTGRDPLSALRRTVPTMSPTGYWPMEDGPIATAATSAVAGVANLAATGVVDFAASGGPAGSASLCGNLASETGSLSVPDILTGGSAIDWTLAFVFEAIESQNAILVDWYDPTSATDPYWVIAYDGSNHGIQVSSYLAGIQSTIAGFINPPMTSGFHTLVWRQQAGGTRDLIVDGVTIAGTTPGTSGPPRHMGVATFNTNVFATPGNVSMGHIMMWANSSVDTSNLLTVMQGYPGELAAVRMQRLCDEEGVIIDIAAGDTSAMGPQLVGGLLDLLRECELTDEGVLLERLDGRLGYDPRVSRYNVAVSLALQFDPQVTDLVPVDDDRTLYNRITVTRTGGGSGTAEQETGPVGTDDTTGVGLRPLPLERSLATDEATVDHASYLLRRGTINQPRYQLVLDLIANPDLIDDWLACDIGSRITVDGAPAKHVGPNMLDLILEGYAETFDPVTWLVAMWLEPYDPYVVAIVSDPAAIQDVPRIGSGTATLQAGIDSDDLSFGIVAGSGGVWTTLAGDFPLDVDIEGERVRLSTITGSSSPQTATVSARSVNGVSKSHLAGVPVEVWQIARVGL